MREPHFWTVADKHARASAPMIKLLLTPVSIAYAWAGRRRILTTLPADAGIPVICVGAITMGGAGKTPVTAKVREMLAGRGKRAASLSRGYGGSQAGPLKVDPAEHSASEVGDEPLMLAGLGESWVAKDRASGATAMKADGVEVIVMDDGHQNPVLKKDLSLVVIDAALPFGNGHIFPKGPLREKISPGLARADGVVLMGKGPAPAALEGIGKPVLRAHLAPLAPLPGGRYVAFAGIGRPFRFFDELQAREGIVLAEGVPFPDHHAFDPGDLRFLMKLAATHDAQLVTTDKDFVRLPAEMRARVARVSVEAQFDDEAALAALLSGVAP